MKITLPIISDVLFSAFISFILSFVLLNYFFDRLPAISLSLTLSLIIAIFAFKKFTAKSEKQKLNVKEKRERDIALSQLNLYTTTEKNDLIERALKNAGYQTKRRRGGIYLADKRVYIYALFSFDGVSKSDVVKVFNTISSLDTAYIISGKFLPEVLEFAARFDGRIKTAEFDGVYNFLLENGALPRQKFVFKDKTPLNFAVLKTLFLKKNAKKLFFFGLLFLFSSPFVPLKIYYVIFGCLFLIMALFSKLFGYDNIKTHN